RPLAGVLRPRQPILRPDLHALPARPPRRLERAGRRSPALLGRLGLVFRGPPTRRRRGRRSPPMTDGMTRADVVAAVRRLRRLPAGRVEIACDNVDAIPMRDALDLYLALAGGAASVWCDAAGRRSPA